LKWPTLRLKKPHPAAPPKPPLPVAPPPPPPPPRPDDFGTEWNDIVVDGKSYGLAHLHPFDMTINLPRGPATVRVAFGHHVFTDEKDVGPRFPYGGKPRYLATERIDRSLGLPALLQKSFPVEYARACLGPDGSEQFFMLQESDWAIFFTLKLLEPAANQFRMFIVSAYTAKPARQSLPGHNHRLYKTAKIMEMMLDGKVIDHEPIRYARKPKGLQRY